MAIYALGDAVPTIPASAFVHPDAVVIGDVTLGERASVWPTAVLRADFGRIVVGDRTSVQDGTVVHVIEEQPTTIGADCVVGHNAHLEGCTIGDWCLVGSGSVVLNFASVGTGSVIAAGAVVRERAQVPAGSMAVGVPAQVRPVPADAAEWIRFGVGEYLDNSTRYRDQLRRLD
ncbi:gamma carbonic anhydrase family protein [Janibacter sp. G349]|uniref:gamma carbonic anhydrase family protein n=1 Tax=unclassified Janibacter TaxID=2649294 RepID=UPI0020CC353B|nr:gamma carbonic anhydrase family protein [Janibacter sp. CX7]UTT66813.1 gamma carbonic anhydrase family protein [Janibacter sp. CX7]